MKRVVMILLFINVFAFVLRAQNKLPFNASELAQLKKLKAKVEANPSDLKAHQAYIDVFSIHQKLDESELEDQYKNWVKRFPKIYAVPFAIGKAYANQKNAKAIPFLLQANMLKPVSSDAWNLLKSNAYFTNDLVTRQGYMKKAMQYNPTNADFAYDYARSFEDTNPRYSDSLYLDVSRRFPNSESGAYALLILAEHTDIYAEKVAFFKQIQSRYPNKQSYQYKDTMGDYFDLLLNNNPENAFELGLEMVLQDKLFQDFWNDRLKVAHQFVQAKKFMTENQGEKALILLNQVALDNPALNYHINAKETLSLLKAEAANAVNKTHLAYDSLIVLYSKVPTERLNKAVFKYGCKLGIDSNEIQKAVFKLRSNNLKQAKTFQLQSFLTGQNVNLTDYNGQVVLLTYWFPLCTPCRMEFLHFESVLNKTDRTNIAYLGLNVDTKDEELVLPFLKETGYTFTALRDSWKREKGNLAAPGAPTNYLIDQKGRIVFSGFRIDKKNERTLELMIKETLAAKD